MGTLLRSDRPLRVDELHAEVLASRPVEWKSRPLTRRKVADVSRYPERLGRVRRVRRGEWEAVGSACSRTSRWRYTRWERDWNRDPLGWLIPSSG